MNEREARNRIEYALALGREGGVAKFDEMIFVLEREIAAKKASMNAHLLAYGDSDIDFKPWGQKVFVLDALYEFLVKLNGEDEVKALIRKRLKDAKKAVDNGGHGRLEPIGDYHERADDR